MSSWIATSKGPVSKKAELDLKMHSGDKRNKRTKAQYEAALKAVELLLPTLNAPVNITLSGHHDGDGPEQVQVALLEDEVAKADG